MVPEGPTSLSHSCNRGHSVPLGPGGHKSSPHHLGHTLARKIRFNSDAEGWFGAFHGPWAEKDLNPVMDRLYLSRAKEFAESVWGDKKLTHPLKQK